MYFSEVFFSPPEDFFYAIQPYFEEEANRSKDLALPYLQNRAPSTPNRSQDTREYVHQNRIFFKQISG